MCCISMPEVKELNLGMTDFVMCICALSIDLFGALENDCDCRFITCILCRFFCLWSLVGFYA